jgi:hypothetical protein
MGCPVGKHHGHTARLAHVGTRQHGRTRAVPHGMSEWVTASTASTASVYSLSIE